MASKPAPAKAATPAKATPTPNVASQLAAVQKQIQTTTLGVAQSLASEAKNAAAAQSLAETQAASYQQQLAAAQAQIQTTQAAQQTAKNDALAAFKDKFTALGLGTLADAITTKVTSPDAPTTASGWYSLLLSTPEYKARFGNTNAMRTKNGLAQLTEAQIMTAEGNIASTLRNMGMPAGFYDQPADFQQFIALDKSAQEVGDIVQAYKNIASNNVDPAIKNALQTYYGIDLGGVTAMLMDPSKAQPILNAITQKGTTAAAAAGAGITDIAGAAQVAGGLGAGTMTYAKQADAFAQSQLLAQQATPLSNIYSQQLGTTYSSAQSMQEAFGGPQSVQAAEQRKKLTNLETSTFGGSAGASQQGQSLGIANQQGVQ